MIELMTGLRAEMMGGMAEAGRECVISRRVMCMFSGGMSQMPGSS
jgi:hypothetical protein